ncbi:MAG: hypothetical protein PHO63_00650 [Bacilli bacterium]|nr:hypothetical protein [Bacilli bacterium]MDD4809456.1 hypothetical protein [Bacilli bacterium]
MKRKTKSDKKYVIFVLIAILLSFTVGYALFSEVLNISGTATTTGTFDIEFTSATPAASPDTIGCNPTATISADKNTLTIAVPDLSQPGAKATINVVVTNVGNIAAELLSVDVTGNTDPDIVVQYPNWPTTVTLEPLQTYEFPVVVSWDPDSSTSNKEVTFTAALNYQQAS